VNYLESGSYFGEIALLTNLKRTATVRAHENCTLASMDRGTMKRLKEEYPSIYLNFYRTLDSYCDVEMELRKAFIRNVPYLRRVKEETINQVLYHMEEKTFDHGSYLQKQGDITNEIYILWKGEVAVEVTDENDRSHKFDTLNEGSCFCVYQAFKPEIPMLFDFRVTTNHAVIFSVKLSTLEFIKKKDLNLADGIRKTKYEVDYGRKSDFDYFRYVAPQN